MPFKIGDKVILKTQDPAYGIGNKAVLSEVGTIVEQGTKYPWRIDFPSHKGFYAKDSELAPEGSKPIVPPHGQDNKIRIVMGTPPDVADKPIDVPSMSPASSQETDEIILQWKLDKSLSLATLAADFYTLIAIQCDFSNEPPVNEALEELTKLLADQFSAYLDMVIGGELRYAQNNIINDRGDEGYKDVDDMPLGETAKGILRSFASYRDFSGRTPVWGEWQSIRKTLGMEALYNAKRIFNLGWAGGYGGESWANATSILIDYLEHRLTAQVFIDTCFGLHHNNNIILDKVWAVDKALLRVLDYNKTDQMKGVAMYCSPKIQNLKWKVCGE